MVLGAGSLKPKCQQYHVPSRALGKDVFLPHPAPGARGGLGLVLPDSPLCVRLPVAFLLCLSSPHSFVKMLSWDLGPTLTQDNLI